MRAAIADEGAQGAWVSDEAALWSALVRPSAASGKEQN
jgi:hypothetical protein